MAEPLVCEVCEQPNGWALLDLKYRYCCQECYEDGQAEQNEDGFYRAVLTCQGCARRSGPVNYEIPSDNVILFYCGSSERCIP